MSSTGRPPGSLSRLESAIQKLNKTQFSWSLCFIGENQSAKLADLIGDLRRGYSTTGDGKKFASGFSYWGLGPTIAWVDACRDPLYKLMQESLRTFPKSWERIHESLGGRAYHYVSLGVGDGQKDLTILKDLNRNKNLYYFPLDMSSEMVRFGIQEALEGKQPRLAQDLADSSGLLVRGERLRIEDVVPRDRQR